MQNKLVFLLIGVLSSVYKQLKKERQTFLFCRFPFFSNCFLYSAVSSTDMINDEFKRRMTSSQGGLTPRLQRKGELCCVVIRGIAPLGVRVEG